MGARDVVGADEGLTLFDLEAMAKAVSPKTKMVFICNPNNPYGTFVTADELDGFPGCSTPLVVLGGDGMSLYYEYVD